MSTQDEATLEELNKKIELAVAQLDRQYGKGTVMRLDDEPQAWPAFSTGALTLDLALGIGGLPKGRIVEIYGPESSGKSTLCLNTIAAAQKEGGKCLFIDAEHAVDPGYAKALGVNMEEILFAQPSTGEEALDILSKLMGTGGVDVIVVDSVAALVPRAELEGEIGDNHVGRLPRLMAQTMRMITGATAKTNTTVIFTNQIREKIGVMFGNPETQPGGRALKFACSVRLDLRKREDIKDKAGNIVGSKVEAKVVKNKMAPPFKKCFFQINYGRGIDRMHSVLEAATTYGVVIKKGGGYYEYDGENVARGEDDMIAFLASDLDLTKKIEQEIFNRARGM